MSSYAFTFASPIKSAAESAGPNAGQSDSSQNELRLSSASATATAAGVLLRWRTNAVADNLGFNVYRIQDGQRKRVNREIIPGALFASGTPAQMRGGYSYSWFDRSGTSNATYFIESVSVEGVAKIHEAISPVTSKAVSEFEQTPETLSGGSVSAAESTDRFEKHYPAEEAQQPGSPSGTIQEQWGIAGQTALKIAIKKDGWYRVTQQEMVAAGFNPTVDIRNLRLYVDANEVAINTNQFSGQFNSGDYIEFYGRGLDLPTTDTRIYYLIAGTTPGKRVGGQLQLDYDPIDPPVPTSTPPPTSLPPASNSPAFTAPVFRDPIFFSWVEQNLRLMLRPLSRADTANTSTADSNAPLLRNSPNSNPKPDKTSTDNSQLDSGQGVGSAAEVKPEQEQAGAVARSKRDDNAPLASVVHDPAITTAPKAIKSDASASPRTRATGRQLRKSRKSKKGKRTRPRRRPGQERNHAVLSGGFAPANFDYTIETKDKFVYFSSLLNGDQENFFGRVLGGATPVTQTLTVSNPDLTPGGSAKLEVALQGGAGQSANHQVSVAVNGTTVGSMAFFFFEHAVQTLTVPIELVHSGSNNLTFTKTSTGELCIVDYVRLTYPHVFNTDAGSLKFNLRGSQTLKVDGFSTPSVRLIDYTDPLNVAIAKPESEPSTAGYAITVPTTESRSKAQRLLYAIPEGQFDLPASLSLNQPSTLNLNSNAADFLIVSYKTFIPSFTANVSPINTSLVAQRQSQGLTTSIVDIEDVYDEFGYGVHGPQALRDFLQFAATHWATQPRYVIFAGDASLDPRNYMNNGNFDLLPTKLVDATYNETCSDDWLTDFDDDGIADIPVGRLPLRTVAEMDLAVSKIVNYSPANVPQVALLIADDPGTPAIWDFETASDDVEDLLPASMPVQKSYRRLEIKVLTGTINTDSSSTTVTGNGTLFTNQWGEIQLGTEIAKSTGERLGKVASIANDTTLTLTANATATYTGAYGKQDDATQTAHIISGFNTGKSIVNYSGHGQVDVWTGASIFTVTHAGALTNGNKLPFVIVMDCLNGYFQDPLLLSLSEAFLKAPNGGAVAAFASSGLTTTFGQRQMELQLYASLYGGQSMALGDAVKIAKNATFDIDVKRTWIYFGDPSLKIR